jgi:reactive intermediate/imine deaminase
MEESVKQRILLGVMLMACCLAVGASDRKYIVKPRSANRKGLPFSDAVLAGTTLFVAGHIGLDPKTDIPPDSPEEEARLVMDGVKQTVESAGFTMDDMVSIQVYCTDLKLYDTFNAVYKTYFHGDYPARMFVGIDKVLRGGRFEVMGTAIKKSQ